MGLADREVVVGQGGAHHRTAQQQAPRRRGVAAGLRHQVRHRGSQRHDEIAGPGDAGLLTLNALRSTRPILLKTGRVLKLDAQQMVRWVLFPAAVPETFTGIRVGFSLTLIGTILGEMFAAQHGLGYLLMNAIGLYNVDVIMAVTFLLVVFAAGVNAVLLAIDRRLHFRA